jgi:2,4-dienoyl-CoA reductase-like NADH-dependent reductase (Old Yellow Enzyme family)
LDEDDVCSLMPFEPIDLKILQGRHNYHTMTSNEIMQEMRAFKAATKNAKDASPRAIGMQKRWKPSLESQGCGA